jgi:2'-5' RNA ligase
MTQSFFPTMPELGAMEFLPPVTVGWTYDEAYALLTGKMPYIDVIIAAADVQTGAMIAFIPASDDLAELVLDGEDTEPLEELHCTAIYLGDADEYDDEMRQMIYTAVAAYAASQPSIRGDLFAYSVFNPETEDSCLVADVGGVDLEDAQAAMLELCDDLELGIPNQHVPWRPHITLAYTEDPRTLMTDELMTKTGPMIFDRVRVAFASVVTDYPLGEPLPA